jgi:hypothetical protein
MGHLAGRHDDHLNGPFSQRTIRLSGWAVPYIFFYFFTTVLCFELCFNTVRISIVYLI